MKKVVLINKIEDNDDNDSEECIKIKGKRQTENKHINMNAYVNSTIELNSPLKLYKKIGRNFIF